MRIFFLIRSLDVGGAERQLVELVKGLDKTCFAITVAIFYAGGDLWPILQAVPGVTVIVLNKQGRWDLLPFVQRLWRVMREVRPDIVYGYMGVANELGLLVGKLYGAKVVWGLRSSFVDFSRYDWAARWSFRMGAWLSRFPDLIVVNSNAGKQHHVTHGYSGARMVMISNGIDTERCRPDPEIGRLMRAEWGVAEGVPLIGLVGRLDPMKDHPAFLRAAATLAHTCPDARFVCVGGGPEAYAAELRALGESLNLAERLIWTGTLKDMPAVYNAFDLLASSSAFGEGFSNVIGEAMACGVPCVVTDVGDAAFIVGETGAVVPTRAPAVLAQAWARLLALPPAEREALGAKARERIVTHFSRASMVAQTEALLLGLTGV
jgi:glycosyltransferase involved in cell wall biosynthesis